MWPYSRVKILIVQGAPHLMYVLIRGALSSSIYAWQQKGSVGGSDEYSDSR
jgi:hypothetical protein